MTTAPTPSEAESLAVHLDQRAALAIPPVVDSLSKAAASMLRRLQSENERMRAELEARKPLPPTDMTVTQHVNALVGDGLTAQKVGAICEREPYEVTGVVLSLPDGRACIVNQSAVRWFHGTRDFWSVLHPDSTANPLSDEHIDAIAEGMPGGLDGFLKAWGWRQFARKILDLRAMPTWEPGFDFMVPGQEELAMQFCLEIAGPRGQKGSPSDPVRLLEMCQALYKVEADARGITKDDAEMKAVITFTDNGDQVDVVVEFEPGGVCQESAAHHMAVNAMQGLARYLNEGIDQEDK